MLETESARRGVEPVRAWVRSKGLELGLGLVLGVGLELELGLGLGIGFRIRVRDKCKNFDEVSLR